MKHCYIVSLALCIGSSALFAQRNQQRVDPRLTRVNNEFHLGAHLFRYPRPATSELKEDMRNLKAHGFDLIKIQTHWAIDEPVEGKYDFEFYDEIIHYAEELNMVVYLGLTLEHAPIWLYKQHPEVRMVGDKGIPIVYETPYTMPSDGKPGPCFDNPVALAKQNQYIQAIVTHLGRHKNILVWNTWQEVAHWPERLIGTRICYCPYTLNHFRNWLQHKYNSLPALNDAWRTNFGVWEDVDAPRQFGVGSGQDVDWNYFMANEYKEHTLKARYSAILEADPLKRPVFAHVSAPNVGSGAEWTYARCQDFFGSSSYPAWGPFHGWDDASPDHSPIQRYSSLLTEMWASLALNFDYIRSASGQGKPVWAAEFQGGPVGTEFRKGRVPSEGDIRRYMLTVVGSGVTAISFWVVRAEIIAQENNGFSLLESEGKTTARFEEASRIGTALKKYPDIFARNSKPASSVGIVIDEVNNSFTNSYYGTSEHLFYSVRGWYKMLWDLGIPVDFIALQDINDKTSNQHKALVIPFPISLADSSAVRLEKYVKGGGNLISEAAIGRIDETGICPRGELSPRMRDLLGVQQTSFTQVKEPDDEKRWMTTERVWGEQLDPVKLTGVGPMKGQAIQANFYLETFNPIHAEAILKSGNQVAGSVRRVGKGQAWILGTFVGHSGTAHVQPSTLAFVESLMNQCAVKRENVGKLLLRKRIGDDREAWILTNPTQEDVTEQINLKGWRKVKDLLEGDVTVVNESISVTVKSLDVRVLIVEK